MNYRQLYQAVEEHVTSQGGTPRPVSFEFLRELVTSDKSLVEQLDVFRVTYHPPIREARFTLFDERESRHDEPIYFAEISFCASLDDTPTFLLYALTKELMHVFDPMDTWINTRDKFISFLRDLQNRPLEMQNGAIAVEHKARWMALLALCPMPIRIYIKDSVASGKMKEELAQELGLPSAVIDIALDDYYEEAHALMLA
jgi:hypothetical protein